MQIIRILYNTRLRVSDSEKTNKSVISSFTTETTYLSLKLVGSLHKQVLGSIYFDSDGNQKYNL